MEKEQSKKNNIVKIVAGTLWCTVWVIIIWIIWLFCLFEFMLGQGMKEIWKEAEITEISTEQKDWWYTYELGFSSSPNYEQYTLKLVKPLDETEQYSNNTVKISSKDYPRIGYFYYDKYYLYLNLKFEDWKITKRSVIDKKTKEDLWTLNSEEAGEKYYFYKKYETKKIEAKDIYNLSELEENTIYELYIGMDEDLLTSINNDLNYAVTVHLRWFSWVSWGVFKPYIYLKGKKDNWWPKWHKGWGQERQFIFQKATKEDVQLILEN
jgi:hypothetical protein